jgi:hypothetical protein
VVVVVVEISMSAAAGVDDVDEHQGAVAGEVDEDVVRRADRPVPGQLGALAADLADGAVGEGHPRGCPGRVVIAQQRPPRLLVADARQRVEQHDAVAGGQERRLVDAVGDPVKVPLHAPDVIPLVVEGRAER